MKTICKQCSTEYDREVLDIIAEYVPKLCDKCLAENATARREEGVRHKQAVNMQKWSLVCPPEFNETELSRLPNVEAAQSVLNWQYSKRGMLLYGPTGRGKSRAVWLLLRKFFLLGQHCNFQVMDSLSGFEYASAFSAGTSFDWVTRKATASILFMDDTFKVKLTDSFEAAAFAIIENRLSHQLPIIATLNDTGDTLTARMTEDRGAAFVRRLKEMCEVVNF